MTESEAVKDEDGNAIPGSNRPCLVMMDLPPGLDEAGKRSRDAIERACKKAVYTDGLTEFGNKKLVVISYGDFFTVDYERVTVIKLLPPERAEKIRADNGKDILDEEEEPNDSSSYDDEDDDDDDGDDGEES